MNPGKSIFSYFVCFIFTLFCTTAFILCLLSCPFMSCLHSNIEKGMIVCGFLLVLIAIYGILRITAEKIYEKMHHTASLMRILSFVLPLLVLFGVVVRLALYLMNHVPIILPDASFYEAATIQSESAGSGFLYHGASQLYLLALRSIFYLFGNKPFCGIVFQIVLFFIALMMLYFAVYQLSGPIAGAIGMAFFGLMPPVLKFIFSLTPELFYVVFYSIGLYFVSRVFQGIKEKKHEKLTRHLLLIPLGMYLAFTLYLDLFSFSLFFFFFAIWNLDELKQNRRKTVFLALFTMIGVLDGVVLVLALIAMSGYGRIADYFTGLGHVYTLYDKISFFVTTSDENAYVSAFILAFAFWACISFWFLKRNYVSAYMISTLGIATVITTINTYMDMQLLNSTFFYLMAALGISSIVRMEPVVERKEGKRVDVMLPMPKEPSHNPLPSEPLPSEPSHNPLPGEPLHNPLPVPKKHEKKVLCFGKEVGEKDMHFDVEVNAGDDFDH